jgi:hypothetical protein
MSVFAKIFSQIFDSSISSDYIVRHTFMDLLVLADRDGVVDMTTDAIARRTNVPEEMIVHAIAKLAAPDAQSRSHEEDGCRLVPIDSHRSWGWQIVNYEHYRNLRDEEARRAYFRDAKREQRSKECADSPAASNSVKDSPTNSTQAEAEAEAEEQKPSRAKAARGKPSAECLTLYQAYPRHVAPAAAYRAIGKALRVKSFDYLIAAVNRYAKSVQGTDPQYIAHPATWFNAGRYDDEPSALFPSGGKSNVGPDKNQPSPAKQRIDGARRVLAEIAIERGLYNPACADGRPDAQVPEPGPAGEHR